MFKLGVFYYRVVLHESHLTTCSCCACFKWSAHQEEEEINKWWVVDFFDKIMKYAIFFYLNITCTIIKYKVSDGIEYDWNKITCVI